MKRVLVVGAFFLMLISTSICFAETTPTMSLAIPWGGGLAQIDQWMTEQGYNDKAIMNQGNAVRYRGTTNSDSEYVVLSLWNNRLYKATSSGICQIRDEARKGELRECFSRLAMMFTERYGPPTRKLQWEESQIHYWTKISDPPWKREELDLMLSMHGPEGGVTEGSVQVWLVNKSLEHILFSRRNDSTLIESPLFTSYSVATQEQEYFFHEAASRVLVQRDNPAIFWLKLTPRQATKERILAVRQQSGLESGRFADVDYVLCKVAVFPDKFTIQQQIYFDADGEVIADWNLQEWDSGEQPGAMVADLSQAILPYYFYIKKHNLPSGFAGIPWGSSPEAIPGAMQDETLVKVLRIYTAYTDVSALLGDVPQVKKNWLVFHRDKGLQRGVINFDGRFYEQVLQRLTGMLGNPRWERGNELYWQIADDLKIGISIIPAFGKLHGSLHVQNPQFADTERMLFSRTNKK
ncbi:MAG: hypothetical protein AB9917_01760 [Negativicutes bacterium]